MKKRAYETYYRDKFGELKVQLVDAETGELVTNPKDYTVVDSTDVQGQEVTGNPAVEDTSSATPSEAKTVMKPTSMRRFAEGGNRGKRGKGSKGNVSNNFGFVHKPSWSKYVGMAVGLVNPMAGMAAKAVDLGINANNVNAINQAREFLGLEGLSTKDIVKGTLRGVDEGSVGDVKIGDKTYGAAFGGGVIDGKTTMTPQEVRTRQDYKAMQEKVHAGLVARGFQAKSKLHPELDPNALDTPSTTSTTSPTLTSTAPGVSKIDTTDMSKRDAFYAEQYGYAKEAGLTGIAADVAVSQAALESGYGRSAPGNNYHGMKGGKSYKGKTNSLATKEQDASGKSYGVKSSFRAYASPVDSYRDWAKQVERNWPDVFSATTIEEAVDALQDKGRLGSYASDKKYKSKVTAKYNELKALNLDSMAPSTAPATSSVNNFGYTPPNPDETMDAGLREQGFKPGDPSYDAFHQLDKVQGSTTPFGQYSAGFYSAIQAQPDPQAQANKARRDAANRPQIAKMDNPMSPTAGMNLANPGASSSANFGRIDSPSSGRPSSTSFGSTTGTGSSNYGRSDSPSSGRSSFGSSAGGGSFGHGYGAGMSSVGKGNAGSSFSAGPSGFSSGSKSGSSTSFSSGGYASKSTSDKDKDRSMDGRSQGPSGGGYGGWGGPR